MGTLFFPLMFLLLGILLLWIIIGCNGWVSAKIWLINVVVFFVLIFWLGVKSYKGWPSEMNMPEVCRLVGVISNEPESIYIVGEMHDAENLYDKVWYDFVYYKPDDTARMFKIPYSQEAHRKLEEAMNEVKKGKYVVLSQKKLPKYGDSDASYGGMTKNADMQIYVLPPSKLIKKPSN